MHLQNAMEFVNLVLSISGILETQLFQVLLEFVLFKKKHTDKNKRK